MSLALVLATAICAAPEEPPRTENVIEGVGPMEWGKGRDIDWSSFNYYNFASDWSEVSSQEFNAIQKRAHLRYYSRPRNFLRVVRSIRLRQYPYILRRIANLGAFRTEEVPKVDYHTA